MQRRAGHAPGQGGGTWQPGADLRPAAEPLYPAADRRRAGPALGPDAGTDLMSPDHERPER
nr:hypothetical protein [Bordetella pseudohinzii]